MSKKKDKNQYGLSRYIPRKIRRQIRQNAGFGCVICGFGIYEYEHVDPVFIEAREHNAEHMTLLCPNCHYHVTTGRYSKERVKTAMQNPKCKSIGYTSDSIEIGKNGIPKVEIGSNVIINCPNILELGGEQVLKVTRPEKPGTPFRLHATFRDDHDNVILQISANQWEASSDNWDIEQDGKELIIRRGLGDIVLKISFHPPDTIKILKLKMKTNGHSIEVSETKIITETPGTGRGIWESNKVERTGHGLVISNDEVFV